MRTTDPEPQPLPPLGEKVAKPTPPPPPAGDWKPMPEAPHIERDRQGHLRTNLPLPK